LKRKEKELFLIVVLRRMNDNFLSMLLFDSDLEFDFSIFWHEFGMSSALSENNFKFITHVSLITLFFEPTCRIFERHFRRVYNMDSQQR
jgi:hypothetical protein